MDESFAVVVWLHGRIDPDVVFVTQSINDAYEIREKIVAMARDDVGVQVIGANNPKHLPKDVEIAEKLAALGYLAAQNPHKGGCMHDKILSIMQSLAGNDEDAQEDE